MMNPVRLMVASKAMIVLIVSPSGHLGRGWPLNLFRTMTSATKQPKLTIDQKISRYQPDKVPCHLVLESICSIAAVGADLNNVELRSEEASPPSRPEPR